MEPQPLWPAGPDLHPEPDPLPADGDADLEAALLAPAQRDRAAVDSIDAQILAGLVSP